LEQELYEAAREAEELCVACHCGSLDLETYDKADFHCYNKAGHEWKLFKITDPRRIAAEKKAMEAVIRLDEVAAPTEEIRAEGKLNRGVTLGWLKLFLDGSHSNGASCADKTTAEVVRDIVKCETRSSRCRFVELPGVGGQRAEVFVSHTWGARFGLLVAALRLALNDDDNVVVWIDIFAVRQWGGNDADLAFEPVVAGTNALVLVSMDVDSITKMSFVDACSSTTTIPYEAQVKCAFFRVWCLVEIAAALLNKKPVVMMVGDVDATGKKFVPKTGMLKNLYCFTCSSKHCFSSSVSISALLNSVEFTICATTVSHKTTKQYTISPVRLPSATSVFLNRNLGVRITCWPTASAVLRPIWTGRAN